MVYVCVNHYSKLGVQVRSCNVSRLGDDVLTCNGCSGGRMRQRGRDEGGSVTLLKLLVTSLKQDPAQGDTFSSSKSLRTRPWLSLS